MTPDHSDIVAIEKRMKTARKRMGELASEVGMAITIIDYDSDQRKNLLARYAVKHIKAGESATAADTLARAEPAYEKELQGLFGNYQLAQATRKDYENEYLAWETARSLLARQRETLKTLPDTEA